MLSSTIKFSIFYITAAHKGVVCLCYIIKIYLFSDIVLYILYKLILCMEKFIKILCYFEN